MRLLLIFEPAHDCVTLLGGFNVFGASGILGPPLDRQLVAGQEGDEAEGIPLEDIHRVETLRLWAPGDVGHPASSRVVRPPRAGLIIEPSPGVTPEQLVVLENLPYVLAAGDVCSGLKPARQIPKGVLDIRRDVRPRDLLLFRAKDRLNLGFDHLLPSAAIRLISSIRASWTRRLRTRRIGTSPSSPVIA